jgi:hypothetical protein
LNFNKDILFQKFNPLNTELNPICHLLALLGAHHILHFSSLRVNVKGKAVPLQAWRGPESSRKLRFPDYMTTTQDGGKVVSLTHRPLLLPRKCSWYSFLLEAGSIPGP